MPDQDHNEVILGRLMLILFVACLAVSIPGSPVQHLPAVIASA